MHLREAGVRHDLIAAAFEQVGVMGIARSGRYEDDLIRLLAKVNALKAFLATDDGTNLLTAYRRASNIVTIEERRDGWQYGQEFEVDLLGQDEEKSLANRLKVVGREVREFLDHEEFDNAMSSLATLRRPVDELDDAGSSGPGVRTLARPPLFVCGLCNAIALTGRIALQLE